MCDSKHILYIMESQNHLMVRSVLEVCISSFNLKGGVRKHGYILRVIMTPTATKFIETSNLSKILQPMKMLPFEVFF